MSRCLYNASFADFINTEDNSIFGALCDNYHGKALTTALEAWKSEISIMKSILFKCQMDAGISRCHEQTPHFCTVTRNR